MARIFFCAVPAALVGLLFGMGLHPYAGVIAAACMFGHGWQVTAPPKSRAHKAQEESK